MLTRILHNSPNLGTFVDHLSLDLSQPQRQHLLNMADALLVCEDEKTLAALQRQFVQAPDASNMADFLRISPWQAQEVRAALRKNQVAWALKQAAQTDAAPVIYVNVDDSLGQKDKATRHLEPVDWFHDHHTSAKTKGKQARYKNAFCDVVCTLRVGDIVVTIDVRLYLRNKTVRRINRQRPKGARLKLQTKNTLARRILAELKPLLPATWQVYVQFDSWYASYRLIKFIHRQGWHVTCALKYNRHLDGLRVDHHASLLKHRQHTRVRVSAADGRSSTYFVRDKVGRLNNLPFEVRVFFSKRHPRHKRLTYFLCTDTALLAQPALQGYHWRWSCEVANFYLKTQLGLGDFRVQSFPAVAKYMVVVLLTWAYVEQRFVTERSSQIKGYGDIIRRHRDEHAQVWLRGAVEMAVETGDVEAVLHHFLRL